MHIPVTQQAARMALERYGRPEECCERSDGGVSEIDRVQNETNKRILVSNNI